MHGSMGGQFKSKQFSRPQWLLLRPGNGVIRQMAAVCPVTDAFYDFLSKLFSFISVQSIYRHYIRKAMSVNIKSSGRENSYMTFCVCALAAACSKPQWLSLRSYRGVMTQMRAAKLGHVVRSHYVGVTIIGMN